MAEGDLLIDGAAIAAATNSLTGINQSLQAGLGTVVTDIEQLLQSGWIGEAADSFRTLYEEGRATFEQLMTEATTITSAIPTVVDTLTESDGSNAGDLGAIEFPLNL